MAASTLVAILLAACASRGPLGPDGRPIEPDAFTLVLLRTGTQPGGDELFAGHFAFMQGLAEEGKLLLAGPFGEVKGADDLRGLFLIDEPDAEVGLQLAQGDPTTTAGVFRQEAFPLRTLSVVRALPELETARQEERASLAEPMDEPDIQPYCIVTAEDGDTARYAFTHPELAKRVVLFGRLGGARDGELFAILAVESAAMARAIVELADEDEVAWEFSEWWGSPALAELARSVPR